MSRPLYPALTPSRPAGAALTLVILSTLAREFGAPDDLFSWISAAGMAAYLISVWPRMWRSGRIFIGLSVVLGAGALLSGAMDVTSLHDALNRAAFIATLLAAFGMLREAASSSQLVRRCGLFLASRRPGWRYVALAMGGHLFGMILNFGVIPLLGALITEGTRAADRTKSDDDSRDLDRGDPDAIRRATIRRLRMVSAVHRGFSTVLAWSPLTVSLAVILTSVPGLVWRDAAPLMLATALGFTGIGWVLDRFSRARLQVAPPPAGRPDTSSRDSWAIVFPVIALIAGLMATGTLLSIASGARLVAAMMLVCPMVAAGWLTLQYAGAKGYRSAARCTGKRLVSHAVEFFPAYHHEFAVVGAAAFIGVVVAALLPQDAVGEMLTHLGVPAWTLLAGSAWLALICGQLGMSPILSVSLIAAAMPPPAVLGVSPVAFGIAFAGAWSLVAASSPYTASVMTSARLASTPAVPLTGPRFGLRVNGPYTVICAVALSAWLYILAG